MTRPLGTVLLDRLHAVQPPYKTEAYDEFVAAMLGTLAYELAAMGHADSWDHALDVAVRYVAQRQQDAALSTYPEAVSA